MKKIIQIITTIWVAFLIFSCPVVTKSSASTVEQQKVTKLKRQIKKTKQQITVQNRRIKHWRHKLATLNTVNSNDQTATTSSSLQQLAALNYTGKNEITVNNNNPNFSAADLSTAKGAWQTYSNLDQLNRAGSANALLNKSLMPTAKRTELTWDPTGWHNKKLSSGWLYNRSHLLGYQLTGQNNNPKNLITGTRELNAPEMLAHEDDIAYYLKQHPAGYVRYRVTPVFRGNELLARGVQMEAQSIGSNAIHFNVYIFNVQNGVTLNYQDGTSQIN
ncbi:hypothetical protein FC89_GL002135 [Liquorilactobacillus ghanensis DSM 18630]|uniref:Type VII secretion system protein EssD-like domain-containing protein n=1 Tax=Liquorilactobacillus ghanensis DSM 18630 TaxID=1423750 RepID=A0A0R1VG88_9LACO|nr:hypothetical protein FC89_GL002135 [Liquorilactobacillus ghanensis DSM 18630]